MRNPLLKQIKDFLTLHWKHGAPVLAACSGGPDSKALLYLLLECKPFFDLQIGVAHVDHGWRPESSHEAEALKKEVEKLGLAFHLKTLKELPQKEGAARESRYKFLMQAAHETGAQAIIFGHQMEDQGETVLKRVLEGASLPACGGMKPVSTMEGMPLWRPLLMSSKKDLIKWLDRQGIAHIFDATNLSSKYLRGRLRSSILPALEESFGKSIVKNLCRLGERAQKMERYLMKQVEPLWREIENSAIGLAHLTELDDLVLDYFLKEWTKREKIVLSAEQLTLLLRMVRVQKRTICLQTPTHRLEVDQGKLAIKSNNYYLNR